MYYPAHASEKHLSQELETAFYETNTFRNVSVDKFYPSDTHDEDASLKMKGLRQNHIQSSLISLFRSLSMTLMSAPDMMTRREWNQRMKQYNGNKKIAKVPAAPAFNVIHQNIPGRHTTKESVGVFIDKLLLRYKPAILFLTEVNPDLVEPNCPPDYKFVRGNLKGKDYIRISALLKVNCDYQIKELDTMVPTLAIEMLGWLFVGVYREWTYGGDPETKDDRVQELIRLKTLVTWWRGKKGKCLIMGDFNLNPNLKNHLQLIRRV